MYTFISPSGQVIKTKTVKEFALMQGFSESHARDLACGVLKRYKGICTGHKSATKERARFLTVLVNPRLGHREILGQSIVAFAKKYHLCTNELNKLITGKKLLYRGWILERTHQLAQSAIAEGFF